jgi:hypothetical protein
VSHVFHGHSIGSAALALAARAALVLLIVLAGTTSRPALAVSPPALTVNSAADGHLDAGATSCTSAAAGGSCTLRAALELNEASGGGSAITIGALQVQLTLGQLEIHRDATLTGAGPASTAVLGDGKSRVFDIDFDTTVAMTGLGVTKGIALEGDADGGGIRSFGSLTLKNVEIRANVAVFGGGIADFGTLLLSGGVVVTGNEAHGPLMAGPAVGLGGGIAEFGKLTATGARLAANTAINAGGNLALGVAVSPDGQVAERGSAAISGSTLTQGTAESGGGLFLDDGGSATITASTLTANAATSRFGGSGGAILNVCGSLTLTNDTLEGNRADNFGGALHQPCEGLGVAQRVSAAATGPSPTAPARAPRPVLGAKRAAAAAPTPAATPEPRRATATLNFVTIAGNAAASFGGLGIASAGDLSTVTIRSSIVANTPQDGSKNCVALFSGVITSLGHNLEDANDCAFTQSGDQVAKDPKLGALKDNGGPTLTMALTAGTPAVDAADPACGVATDQRGIARPQGARCDVGAFELQVAAPPAVSPSPLPAPPVTGAGDPDGVDGLLILAMLLALLAGAAAAVGTRRWLTRKR